jgi:putative sugar O-methyltransferase
VPVAANPSAAETTIASCFAQTVANQIEVLAIEKDGARATFWSERFPQIRVLVSSKAGECVEAHAAGVRLAQSARIRFLTPGDILDPYSLARQIKTLKKLDGQTPVADLRGLNDPQVSVRPIRAREIRPQRMFSAMLFPRSVLARVGGFDLILGEAYQARYLFRLRAAGISVAFTRASKSTVYAKPLASSADQSHCAALTNLVQCLNNRPLWPQIPAIIRTLSGMRKGADENSDPVSVDLLSVKARLLDFTLKTINDLSANAASCSPVAAFALCLVGLEWGRTRQPSSSSQPEVLTSAILNGASGIQLDTLGELSLANALLEADDDPSFTKAAKNVLREIRGRPECAGLQLAVQRLRDGKSTGAHSGASKVNLIERLKWRLRGPSSLTDDLELRGHVQTAALSLVDFAQFRSKLLDRITELNFTAGAQYAQSFLGMSPTYREFLPVFRRNDEVGDPTTYEYPEIGRFSAATLRHVKFLSDMEVLFGSLHGFHIVEIGGGYGGQCRLIMSRFKPATYTIIDLPEMLRLARRYLNYFDVDKAVAFRKPFQCFSQKSIDLVISNYAVSEIRRSNQDRYLRDVIKHARRGYVLYNSTRPSKRIERHSSETPYQLAEFAARIEGATIAADRPLLVEHDKDLGNALIYWDYASVRNRQAT